MSRALIHVGECVETMRLLPADSIDSIGVEVLSPYPEGQRAAPPIEQLARLVLDALGRDLHFVDGMYVSTNRIPK